MHIQAITIFPGLFNNFSCTGLVGRAVTTGKVSFQTIQLRDFSQPPHNNVDDTPYGGGPGMVMKPEPLFSAINKAKENCPNAKVIALSPAGKPFSQSEAIRLSKEKGLIFICGRYEGIDQRIIDCADEEISIGDYVLMGGELPAMVISEAVIRLIPEVLGNSASPEEDSFSNSNLLLEAPQYTKPAEFNGKSVPEVLLSGNHQAISEWRKTESLKRTKERRPDLLEQKN